MLIGTTYDQNWSIPEAPNLHHNTENRVFGENSTNLIINLHSMIQLQWHDTKNPTDVTCRTGFIWCQSRLKIFFLNSINAATNSYTNRQIGTLIQAHIIPQNLSKATAALKIINSNELCIYISTHTAIFQQICTLHVLREQPSHKKQLPYSKCSLSLDAFSLFLLIRRIHADNYISGLLSFSLKFSGCFRTFQ